MSLLRIHVHARRRGRSAPRPLTAAATASRTAVDRRQAALPAFTISAAAVLAPAGGTAAPGRAARRPRRQPLGDQLARPGRRPRRAAARLPPARRDLDQVREGRVAELARGGPAPPPGSRRRRGPRPVCTLGAPVASAWTSTLPPAPPRPLRPASWVISAKVRSSERKSGRRSEPSASRTTPRVTSGKSWPLATIWVPTRTPESASLEAPQQLGVALAAGAVGVEPEDLAAERRAASSARTRPAGVPAPTLRDRHRGAVRARLGRGLGVAAVVAAEAAAAVQHQRDVAFGALPRAPAGAAGEVRRPAAAVDQQDRLAALAPNLGEGLDRPGVERAADGEPGSPSRMSTTSTGGSGRRPRARAARAAPCSRQLSGRGVAVPATSTAPAARRGGSRPRARRSAGRTPACRRSRAPRRSRSGPAPRPGRRRPSAARRRPGPRRSAAAATRRSGRPPTSASAAARRGRRSEPGSGPSSAASARSRGPARSRPSPRSSAARAASR